MSFERVAHILDITTHYERWPVVRWANEHMAKGDVDFGDDYKHLVEHVSIFLPPDMGFAYVVNEESGLIESLRLHYTYANMISDLAHPTSEEMQLISMVYPDEYVVIEELCEHIDKVMFNRPHSCKIQYEVVEEDCHCCESNRGIVNYRRGKRDWVNYCGGSPRCCP